MFRFKKILCFLLFLLPNYLAKGQQAMIPNYFISADLVYAAELIPMLGFERFFMKKEQIRSWHVDLDYQLHYSDKFGLLFNTGDQVSIGVYQGPGAKVGYTYYTKWRNRKWKNYLSPTLGIKYLWYDNVKVNTNHDVDILAPATWRLQSERCVALVPQIYVGQKRDKKHFCFDYYAGLQLPVKFRNKTIYSDQGDPTAQFPHTVHETTPMLDVVFGIKIGYIRMKPQPSEGDNEEEKEDAKDDSRSGDSD